MESRIHKSFLTTSVYLVPLFRRHQEKKWPRQCVTIINRLQHNKIRFITKYPITSANYREQRDTIPTAAVSNLLRLSNEQQKVTSSILILVIKFEIRSFVFSDEKLKERKKIIIAHH
jgi:hypothetical protein